MFHWLFGSYTTCYAFAPQLDDGTSEVTQNKTLLPIGHYTVYFLTKAILASFPLSHDKHMWFQTKGLKML